MSKKRKHAPEPIPIFTTAISPYRRKLTNPELQAMLNELGLYAERIPTELWDQLRCYIAGQIMLDMEKHHEIRHSLMDAAIDEVGRDTAGVIVAKRLGREHKGSTMWRSYWKVEKSLPPEQQRRSKKGWVRWGLARCGLVRPG